MEETEKQEKKQSINEKEQEVLRFWKEHKIFEKSLAQNDGKEAYVFYDGPPFATGLPHHGHLLQGTIKDIIPRYQTMRGRYVRRQWGWDCHGLPVENLIEKELGLKQKKDIEEYGVEKFNDKACASVLTYDEEWKRIIPRMGRWVDMDHAYKTMDPEYTESIWWAFATLHGKKLIYEGYKAMHVCPRCETTLAASEVAQGYKDVKDISVYVKFELTDEPGTFFIAWTTTPWTLPGNVALAVGADMTYVKATIGEEKYIVAKDRLESLLKLIGGEEASLVEELQAKEILGASYKPVFDTYAKDETLENHANGWKVYAADFVTTESGTGIVHIAPAFGEDDMALGRKEKLPFVQHVGMDGKIKNEVEGFAGMYVKPKSDDDKERLGTDIAVLKYLQEKGTFFAKENLMHSYPHCWRCDWPLINYAASSWFVNVTALKPRLIEENREISWVPENIRDGRFGKWLEGARDWAISRSRYWGAPIPVWKCNKCANVEVLGSLTQLREKTSSKNEYFVMRHGESETNTKGIVSHKADDPFPLTERGRTQVKTSASKLKEEGIELIIASPILRTKETAEIVAQTLGLPVEDIIFDARIAEVDTGDFNGCDIDDYRAYFTSTLEKFTKPAPNGETLEQMKTRVGELMYDIERKYHGKKILIVTHEYGVWMLDAIAKGATNAEAAWMKVEGGDDYVANAEVREFHFAQIPHNHKYELDYHRPYIDEVHYQCSCELGTMERVLDVFDCWFESGSMPFAQFHYMGDETTKEGKLFMKNFPADFIAEAVDQTRGWFYNMLILSVGLFDRAAFKSVITTGLILAEDGLKMSKKLKNYPDPMDIAEKYGADALRFYMVNSPVVRGEELRFSASGVDEVVKKITLRVENVWSFYDMYGAGATILRIAPESTHVLDRWIVARWKETHAEVTHYLDTHELDKATRPLMPFLDDLSTWYLRRSRDRFKHQQYSSSTASLRDPSDSSSYTNTTLSSDTPRLAFDASSTDATSQDRESAIATTGWVLLQLSRLMAPFMPFLAEEIYQRLSSEDKKESVHLETWPEMSVGLSTVLEEMDTARMIVEVALAVRAQSGIKVRQPLSELSFKLQTKRSPLGADLLEIIKDEVNVKSVNEREDISEDEGGDKSYQRFESGGVVVALNTKITPELKTEGRLRDLIRHVQDARKKAGLVPEDHITLFVSSGEEMEELLSKHRDELMKTANVRDIETSSADAGTEVSVGDVKVRIAIVKK